MSRPLPKLFIIELTQRCNHRCLHCYTVWGGANAAPHTNPQGEMSTAEVKDVISRLEEETHLEGIGLSGGEPLLRDDLPEIVSFIKERGIAPILITNGTLLTRENVDAIMADAYEVPLLSYRREVHDRLVGRQGAWDAAVEGMANVRRAEGNLVCVFVATRLNYTDLASTAEVAIGLGAKGVMYNRLNLGAHNLRDAAQLLPTPAMIEENLDVLEELGGKYGLPIASTVVLEPCVIDVQRYEHIQFGWCPLAEESSYFTISPGGDIRICNHSPVVLGNIKRDRFADLYYHNPYLRRFRETLPAECLDCSHPLREKCRGGCKAAAEQCYGNLHRVDPFVTLSRALVAAGS